MATIEANPPGAGEWITNIVSAVVSMYVLAWITGGFTTVGLGIGGTVLGAWKRYKV
jgi:hypothetical protein